MILLPWPDSDESSSFCFQCEYSALQAVSASTSHVVQLFGGGKGAPLKDVVVEAKEGRQGNLLLLGLLFLRWRCMGLEEWKVARRSGVGERVAPLFTRPGGGGRVRDRGESAGKGGRVMENQGRLEHGEAMVSERGTESVLILFSFDLFASLRDCKDSTQHSFRCEMFLAGRDQSDAAFHSSPRPSRLICSTISVTSCRPLHEMPNLPFPGPVRQSWQATMGPGRVGSKSEDWLSIQ